MNEIDILVELASPPNSASSTYGCDTDRYYDSPSPSTALSPVTSVTSPHEFPFSNEYPSPEQTEGATDTNQPESEDLAATKPKRKRENRYKNAPPSVLSRRRAQNRASQRAYRERKDQRIKDLEVIISETQKKNEALTQAYASLQTELETLKSQQAAQVWQPGMTWDPAITSPPLGDMLLYFGDQTTTTNFDM
ncbi:hypothetical protein HD806DRAFT_439704 [Xylariaceae sp. AK1471]|nr:hypothetical protein HD806DRAFT_439704 [Xylariaceae sp. AK1471]